IRGNIIDYLRKVDQLPRTQRKNYGEVKHAIKQLSQQLGREPTDEEVANELGMPIDDYLQLLSNVQQRNTLSLDKPFSNENSNSFYEVYADPKAPSPDSDLEKKEMAQTLKEKIGQLNDRNRLI